MVYHILSCRLPSYTANDVTIEIDPVVPTDEKEDAEIRKLDAETRREQMGHFLMWKLSLTRIFC